MSPKGRKVTIHSKQDAPDPTEEQSWKPEPEPIYTVHPDDEEIDEVFSDFPQNEPCIELWRIHPQGGRPLFLEQITPAMFSFAYVTEKFGGGKYQAKAKYKDGSKTRMPFEIEGDSFPVRRTPSGTYQPVPPSDAKSVASGFDPNVEILPGTDPMQAMVGLFRSMIHEMRNSETQVLEKFRLYKELFAPVQKAEAPLDTALNMFQRGLEMASLAGGEGGNPWLFAIRELKEPLSKIVDTVQLALTKPQRRPAPVPGFPTPSASLPGADTKAETGGTPEPQTSVDQMWMLRLKAVLPNLINGAAKNADPQTYTEFLLDQIPQSSYTDLRDWLMKPDCLEDLAKIEPGIRFQQDWWSDLRILLLAALNEEVGHAVRSVHPVPPEDPPTESSTDHDEVS